MLDVSFHYLSGNAKPFKNRTLVRFHAGTSEIFGNLILLAEEELVPGKTTVAQLRLEALSAYQEEVSSGARIIHRVRIGPFLERDEATRVAGELRANMNLDGVVMSAD